MICAVACPMPLAAAVMSATLSLNRMCGSPVSAAPAEGPDSLRARSVGGLGGRPEPPMSMGREAGDRHDEMQVAAELVDLPHVVRDERRALGVGEIRAAQRGLRVREEARAEGGILLQPVEQAVDLVAAHASCHSTAARSMRGSSPK